MKAIAGTKRYIPLGENEHKETHIEVEVGYQLGGMNYWNYQTESRGYYLYATPCQLSTHPTSTGGEWQSITTTVGRGFKWLLKEVSRQSKKAEAEAIAIANEKMDWLIEKVCERYGLTLKEAEYETLKKAN